MNPKLDRKMVSSGHPEPYNKTAVRMVNNQWQGELRLQMPRVITLDYPGDPRVITRTVKCGKGR